MQCFVAPVDDPAAPRRGRPRDPRRDAAILRGRAHADRRGRLRPHDARRRRGPRRREQADDLPCAAPAARRTSSPRPCAQPRGPAAGAGHRQPARRPLALCATRRRLNENAHLAAGLALPLRASAELAALFREHVVSPERARLRDLSRAVARGELADAGAAHAAVRRRRRRPLIHSRVLFPGEPVDDAFVDELVDRVLLPILSPPRKDPHDRHRPSRRPPGGARARSTAGC